jgi:tripartite-type tricarboxylate transporter receptor subunit TctC
MNIRARYVLVSLLCLLLAVLNGAHAQAAYPDRPIRFIVPYPAGGGADQITRLLAGATEGALGQPFVVDNRSGAGGGVGTDAVAKARPDGYTIGLAAIAPMSILPFAQSNLAYDPLRDLAPVTLINTNPFLVVVHPSVPANNVAELITHLKAQPGKLNYASVGNGSLGHLAGELFKSMAAVDMAHVPFRGGAPAILDMLAGRTQVMFANIHEALPHVKAGKLRALAVTSLQRSELVPDVPTVNEAGLAGYEAIAWNGVAAPAGTPKEIVDRLSTEMTKAIRLPATVAKMREMGLTPVGGSPAEFADVIRREQVKWGALIKKINLQLN